MSNNVDHPAHYQADGFEAIDIIAAFTKELHGVEAFDVGNAIKYLLRWDKKNGAEDIDKAIWYLVHLKNHLKDEEKSSKKTGPTYELEYPNGAKIHVENGKVNVDDYLKQLEKEKE